MPAYTITMAPILRGMRYGKSYVTVVEAENSTWAIEQAEEVIALGTGWKATQLALMTLREVS